MMNLKPYEVIRIVPFYGTVFVQYKNIPMEHLDAAKHTLRVKGLSYRVRYRGTRTHALDTRPRSRRMQDCLKRFANRATIYITA